MKYLSFYIIMVTASILSSNAYAQTSNRSLVGTWKLISSKGSAPRDSSTVHMLKTITPTRFIFTNYSKAGDTLVMSMQGSIAVTGNTYDETVDRCTNKGALGRKFTYTYSVNGNIWHIEGGSGDLRFVEDFVRVD